MLNTEGEDIHMPTSSNLRIGQRLVRYRKQAGIDQADLAKAAGISQPTYSRLERGETQATLPHIYLIAGALDVRPDAIIGRHDQEERVLCSARTDGGPCDMAAMKQRLLDYLEASSYLTEMGY